MTHPNKSAPEDMQASYQALLGVVPDMLAVRQRLARATGREAAIDAIERFRDELIHRNPLDRRTQQLVHFAMLVGRGEAAPARLHAAGAVKAGASLADLQGVVETAAVVCGMPGVGLALQAIAALNLLPADDQDGAVKDRGPSMENGLPQGPEFSAGPEIHVADLDALAAAGFRSIVCFRPDGESPEQTPYSVIAAAAAERGMQAAHIPVLPGLVDGRAAPTFQGLLEKLPRPIYGYCKSGARAAAIWALIQQHIPSPETSI